MKIGIYGDSFAETYPQSKHFAWFNLLTHYIPNARIKSYGKAGTSVFYSYKLFLQTYQTFDVVIFLVTDPNRYTKPMIIDGNDLYPHSIRQIELMLANESISKQDKILLENLRNYYISIIDEEFNAFANELMLQKIETLHKKVIFFPCFPNAMSTERQNKSGLFHTKNTMGHITQMQSNKLKVDNIGFYEENPSKISCHLTEEYNHAVAQFFATKIKDDVWLWNLLDNVKLNTNNKLHYYNKRLDIRSTQD